jgi:RNA polymerase sigma-70 factor, ECF subfamily
MAKLDAPSESPAASEAEASVVALFCECGVPLRRYVGAFGVGAHDVDDIVQDVFYFLFRHLLGGKPQSNLKGWLFTVAQRLALKHLAKRTRQRNRTDVDLTGAREPVDTASDPEEELARKQRQQRLLTVLRALPARDRRCLHLRAEGLRYREIAEATGMSLGAVSKSLTRSISRLVNADDASL